MEEIVKYHNYTNRELSWLDFESRVLEEAIDQDNLLLERVKFLGITQSNIDEFFMIRVASLKEMLHAGYEGLDLAGLSVKEQLNQVSIKAHQISEKLDCVFKYDINVKLSENGIHIISDYKKLDARLGEIVDKFFDKKLYPVLTPVLVDEKRDIPLFRNKSLYIGMRIKKNESSEPEKLAFIQVPAAISRVVVLEKKEKISTVILLEEVIKRNIHKLIKGYEILSLSLFRTVRNADLTIEDEDAADLLKKIEDKLKLRQQGEAIKLDVFNGIDSILLEVLKRGLPISDGDIYEFDIPLDETFLFDIYSLAGYEHLKDKPVEPFEPLDLPVGVDVFETVKQHDVMLFHPYESFEPIINLIEQAATDPQVLAIKQTLYRVGSESPVVKALCKAAKFGKQVTVLVELKARFDEENNIGFAKILEREGCNVIYGLPMLKTHCKLLMIVREEADSVLRYVHVSTGNYNNLTARSYTDIGLLTAREEFGEDATEVFNMLCGTCQNVELKSLSIAPTGLRERFLYLINRERENALKNKPARIIAKLNSLCDLEIIDALYEASGAGVKIDLYVRGICCLKVGIEHLSENISVHSIVGKYLEHSRIYYFENAGEVEYYLSSADWMPRNLDRRVELLFPCLEEIHKKRLEEMFQRMALDNVKSRRLQQDGSYAVIKDDKDRYCFQEKMYEWFEERVNRNR